MTVTLGDWHCAWVDANRKQGTVMAKRQSLTIAVYYEETVIGEASIVRGLWSVVDIRV